MREHETAFEAAMEIRRCKIRRLHVSALVLAREKLRKLDGESLPTLLCR